MTQTLPLYTAPITVDGPMATMVVTSWTGLVQLHITPMRSVEDARDEFGGTLADALMFVEGVCCTECATEATETREHAAVQRACLSCGIPGCGCIVVEDEHSRDTFWCLACRPQCGCRECAD